MEDKTSELRPSLEVKVGRFPERLKQSIKNESIRGFASRCGLSEGVLRNYLRGDTLPTLDRLYLIAETAAVDLAWITTGEGSMYRDDRGHSHAVEGQDHYGPDHQCEWDRQLMGDLIEWLEEGLKIYKQEIIPVEKRKLLLKLYDIYSEEDEAVTRKDIHRDLKLVIVGMN